MTLGELIDVYDQERESEIQQIEVCRPGENWEDFDSVASCSHLLVPIYSARIKCIGTENENAIRISIDWDEFDGRTHIFDRMRRS